MKHYLFIFTLSLLVCSCGSNDHEFTLVAGEVDREQSLISVSIPASLLGEEKELEVVNQESGVSTPAQRIDAQKAVFMLDQPLKKGTERTYVFRSATEKPQAQDGFQSLEKGGDLLLTAGEKVMLTYNQSTDCPPEGLPSYYCRSGYIHPLYSPGGAILTDDFPSGHTHQHGLFFAWVKTNFRGDFTDFWNQQHETGTAAHQELREAVSGAVFAGFTARLQQISLKHGPVLAEEWKVSAFNSQTYNILDLLSIQGNITEDTLYIEKYHYGGLGVRGNRMWNKEDSLFKKEAQVLTSEGKARVEANHSRPKWTAMYGETEKGLAGVAVLDHPSNFRSPQPVRVHPQMPYFCLAPMVEEAMPIAPGLIYQSRYRILTFDGEPDAEQLDKLWEDYANPVDVYFGKNK